jgi:two-component system sensor histidine kinase ChvG
MRQAIKYRSLLAGAAMAAAYLAALAALALQVDRRSFRDLHVRSMQVEATLRSLSPEVLERGADIPRVFPWQRALLLDEGRRVLADTGWLENDTLTSGTPGYFLAGELARIGDLGRAPRIDEDRLTRLMRESPGPAWFGLLDARTIGAARAAWREGRGYGLVLLVDKRDLIAEKHLDRITLLVGFALVLLLPAGLMAFVFARLVLPLDRLARAVRALGEGGGDGRIPPGGGGPGGAADGRPGADRGRHDGCPGPDRARIELPGEGRRDEIGYVSAAFGAALRDARRSGELLEDFVDDALHELKNPVATMRSRIELARMRGGAPGAASGGAQGAAPGPALEAADLDRLLADVGRIERLLAGLRDLSAADSQDTAGRCEPSALLEDLTHAYAELGKPVFLEDELPAGTALPVDPETFSRLVRILVDNALDFSPPGEAVRLSSSLEGDFVLVRVADRGPGIPPDRREWIFGRFASTRKGGAEPHSGLGLAIARSLASRIGSGERRASIRVADSPGGGAVFEFRAPLY